MAEADSSVTPPLSHGACRALGTVLGRLLESPGNDRDSERSSRKKRPRGHVGLILSGDAEIASAATREREERARERENKRAKLHYESLARVVPDAATGAAMEKALRETATRGVVALFNAVAKSQKNLLSAANSSKKKLDPQGKLGRQPQKEPVTKEQFMKMIRSGLKQQDDDASSSIRADSDDSGTEDKKAPWLEEDFLTKGSEKLKSWDRDTKLEDGSSADDDHLDSLDGINNGSGGDSSDRHDSRLAGKISHRQSSNEISSNSSASSSSVDDTDDSSSSDS